MRDIDKKKLTGFLVVVIALLSQLALFWGLDGWMKRLLLPNIVFEEIYQLQGATEDVSGEFALSANGRYLAWINGGFLYVEDLLSRQCCYESAETTEVFVWLPDSSGLVFLAGNRLCSLALEGEMRLNYETEVKLPDPAYTYSRIAVSAHANVIYLMATSPAGEEGFFRIDLNKELEWYVCPEGAFCVHMAVSNKSGMMMLQMEEGESSWLFYLMRDSMSLLELPEGDDGAYVLLGADEDGFFVGRLSVCETAEQGGKEGECLTAVLYYAVDETRDMAEKPVVLWQGERVPASAEFLCFTSGVGWLAETESEGARETYVSKIRYGTNHQASSVSMVFLEKGRFQGDQAVRRVFAANGLTYLEICGDKYCWRLLREGNHKE